MRNDASDQRASGANGSRVMVPEQRVRVVNSAAERADGRYVLYWMTATRRLHANFALQHAVDACRRLGRPLVILEAIRVGYPWACDRFHGFVIQGMRDNNSAIEAAGGPGVRYLPYVERQAGAGSGLLAALAKPACLVVTDDSPTFFLPRMLAAAARQLDDLGVRLEAIDSCGILPRHSTNRQFHRAVDFRRHLQKTFPEHLLEFPAHDPLADLPRDLAAPRLPRGLATRWPMVSRTELREFEQLLAGLPISHSVPVVSGVFGGSVTAGDILNRFLNTRLARYGERGHHPDEEATSTLSPYLHFGHIGPHEVLQAIFDREDWSPARHADSATGGKAGWWGLSEPAEAFIDELVTWRELGINAATTDPAHDRYDSVPGWARASLAAHATDQREYTYDLDAFDAAATHDPLWNAAQRQLREAGTIHNYLRMLWGKKILEWSPSPEAACEVMIDLNNRYALDGRDPNSYSGILWVLGKFDRAWGPERPIFGKVRYMTSESARRKLRLSRYLEKWSYPGQKHF